MAAAVHAGCDRGMAHAAADVVTTARFPNLVLGTCILASSLAFIDGSVVNVGLPAIGRSLNGGADLSWVVTAYLLPLSALLLVGGAAGDRFGRRRLLLLGVGVFTVASGLCAAAPTLGWLLAGRVVQGAGAAMLMPNSLAILGATFSGEARGQAVGSWAAVGAGAGAVGPLLGGWLIDAAGWRMVFLVNLPIAVAAMVMAWRFVPADMPTRQARLDGAGAVLASGGLAAMTWGLTVASSAKGVGLASGAALGGGALLLAAFLAIEQRRGENAMMPLGLFASRRFVGLTVMTLLLYGALGGLLVLLPFVLIEACGYSATLAGAALLPLPAIIAVASPFMGRISARTGPRLPLTIGPCVVAVGFALTVQVGGGPAAYWTRVLPAMLVLSLGMAGAVAPLTTAVLGSVAPGRTGVASGLNSAVARTGGLVTTALCSVVLAAHGADLLGFFRVAVLAGAGVALAAGISAFLLVGGERKDVLS